MTEKLSPELNKILNKFVDRSKLNTDNEQKFRKILEFVFKEGTIAGKINLHKENISFHESQKS